VPVIINEIFARKFFPNEEPVGKHMGDAQREEPAKGPQPGYLIVGVVGNTKYNSVRHDMAHIMYVPLVSNSAHFELRTAADPTALMKSVRDVVSRADNNLPLFQVRTQTAQIEHMLFEMRLMSRLSSLFGILALLLACLGLYGLLSYEVTRRTREIGIRIALGAQRDRVLQLVVGQGILLALLGAALGIAGACGVTRYLADVLYNVHPVDPLTFAAVAVLLFVVALAASCIPAWRAARVDPMEALRYE